MFYLNIVLFFSFIISSYCHPNSYCKGYCSSNYYCAPNSCRRRGRFVCSCSKCPSGKISNSGSWDISQCTGCSPGKYFVNNHCSSCSPGKYQPVMTYIFKCVMALVLMWAFLNFWSIRDYGKPIQHNYLS